MRIQKTASYVLVFTFVIGLLIIGKDFLVPLFLAIVIWYLINTINDFLRQRAKLSKVLPNAITLIISSIVILAVLFVFGNLIAQSIELMTENAPTYRVNIEQQWQRILAYFGLERQSKLSTAATEFNLDNYTGMLINSITGTAQRAFLVFLYVVFLLIEQNTFPKKLSALKWSPERKENFKRILSESNQASRTYIVVKFAASTVTAILSFLVMYAIELDFPVFWAFLIFLLNFIPTIGSIVATAFPAMVALLQFDTLGPFFAVAIGITSIQMVIGSFIEPRLLGNSLNISPFVIILSLVLWGMMWGVVGMLLCVPLTVILIIILAQFPNTRPIAILLSKNGRTGRNS